MAARPAHGTGLEEALSTLPVALLVLDAAGQVRVATPRLRRLLEDARDAPPGGSLLPDATSSDGRSIGPDAWPIHETLRTGVASGERVVEIARRTGLPRSLRVSAHPYRPPDERRPGALMLVEDVSEERERDVLRQDFLSILSHELRSPITTIYSAIHLLRDDRLDGAVRAELLEDVGSQAEAVHRIIEDLLVMSRVEDPRGAVEIEPVLVRRSVQQAIEAARRQWPDVRFAAHLPEGLPPIRADALRLDQVLRNLLANAVKYGGPRGVVEVRATAGDGVVVIRVEDDGPGIPPEYRERVFELFFRAPGRTDVGGSGIGLFIVRRLVEAMDGHVWVADREGRGSAIAIRLPELDESIEFA